MQKRIVREMENDVREFRGNFYSPYNFLKFIQELGGVNIIMRTISGFGQYFYHMPKEGASLFYEVRNKTRNTPPFDSVAKVEIILEGNKSISAIERKILEAEKEHQEKVSV